MLKAGTQVVGGVNARKAGTTVDARRHSDLPGLRHRRGGHGGDRRRRLDRLRAAGLRQGRRASRPSTPSIPLLVVITEGIPVQDSAEFWAYAAGQGQPTRIIGPNCPGIITPGESLAGITPAHHHRQGPDRPGLEVRHADLPDDVRAARPRLLDRHRHRRRPDHRHDAHRRARGVRGRPRHQGDRHDRRDRRRRRGARRRLHQGQRHQAGRRLRRRASPRPRARPWATPAPSSPAPPAPRRPRRRPSRPPGVKVGKTPSETAA